MLHLYISGERRCVKVKFKRVICVVVLLSTLFSFSAFANENNNEDEKLVPVTKEVAAQMAMNWVRSIEPELQLSIGEIREIYDVT